MNYSRKKIALLMSALIIGQAVTMQSLHGMDHIHLDDDANVSYCRLSTLRNGLWNVGSTIATLGNSVYSKFPSSEYILNSSTAKIALPLAFTSLGYTLSPFGETLTNMVLLAGATVAYYPIHQAIKNNQPVTPDLLGQGLNEGAHYMLESVQPSAILAAPFNMVGNGIVNIADNSLNKLNSTLVNGTNKITNTLTTATGNINSVLTHATTDLGTTVDTLVNTADTTLTNGTNRIANTLTTATGNVNTILTHATADVNTILTTATGDARTILTTATTDLNTLVDAADTTLTNGTNRITNVLTHATTDLGTAVDMFVNTTDTSITNGFNKAEASLTNGTKKVATALEKVVDDLSNAATSVVEKPAQQIGKKLFRNIAPYIIGSAAIAAILAKTYYALKAPDTTQHQPLLATSADKQISWYQCFKNFIMRHEETQLPTELIFAPAVQAQLDSVTQLTVNTFFAINKQNNTTMRYEPILSHGATGTGKTSAAKKMINDIYQQTNGNMAWGHTTGALVLEHGINGINAMFAWAKEHNAACIFIDDADILQSSPSNAGIVNHLLYNINEHADKCMVIITATNVNNLSGSIGKHFANNSIHLPLPNESERAQVLRLCRDRILNNASINAELKTSLTEQLNDNKITEIATKTAMLSNTDLHNIINKIVNSSGKKTSITIIDAVVAEYLKTHASMKK